MGGWGGGGGVDKGRVNNLLLNIGSISPAKHEPEEMGSLLCAFAVVCCLVLLRADPESACLYMAPKCTLSTLTEANRGPA